MISKHMHKMTERELYDSYKLFFNTFSSEIRLKILNLLREKPMNVTEITRELKISQTNVSHNLKKLKSCGFVTSETKGRYRRYSLDKKTIIPLLDLIDNHMQKNCLMIIRRLK